MGKGVIGAVAAAVLGMAPAALAQQPSTGGQGGPLSAIDWLSDVIAEPVVLPNPTGQGPDDLTTGIVPDTITVTPLDGVRADAVGLLPAHVTGLPRDLWGSTPSARLAEVLGGLDRTMLPATRRLLLTLLLAELDPPADSDPQGRLLLARVDALLALGAVEQAQALLERAGIADAARFGRWFDASLLTGTEDRACAELDRHPELAPTWTARVFCLARRGDWNAAALTLGTSGALGQISDGERDLLELFLDPALAEETEVPAPPARPSPLIFRLYDAIGEPLPTSGLPLAFAHADLQPQAGWKAQIEAAERLARSGAIDANRLLGIYTDRRPAASGGVWDRVAAVQRLDAALAEGDANRVAATLPAAWREMDTARLSHVLATLFAEPLSGIQLEEPAAALAFRIGLLSSAYESFAQTREPADAAEAFLISVATGTVGDGPDDTLSRAVARGFSAPAPERIARLVATGNRGEAILAAIQMTNEGHAGNPPQLEAGIAGLLAIGLHDTARRAALEALILGARG